jgi:hypothetical protein
LDEQQTRDEIREYLVEQCEELPQQYASLCAAYVNAYADTVIDAIEADVDPLQVCTDIGLCDSTAQRPARVVGSRACDVCQDVVKVVERRGSPEKFCWRAESSQREVCETIARRYAPEIEKALEDGISAVDICAQLHACETKIA